MRFVQSQFKRKVLAIAVVLGVASTLGFMARTLDAADSPVKNKSGSGIFVSFVDGTLTLKSRSGFIVYDKVGENYKTYQNNEEGPGSRLVGTVHALSGSKLPGKITPLTRVMPGTFVRVNVESSEIHFGFDHRVIGKFESYRDSKLNLLAADAPPGFLQIPSGHVSLAIDAGTPTLESVNGDYLHFAGAAEEALKTVKPGALITVRSHYDVEVIEVVEIGEPKYRLERYIGETGGPVQGIFVSFKEGVLRIRGKGVGSSAAGEYERLIARRIGPDIPIFESIDGGAYQPASIEALRTAKEGTIITLRKVEDVILEIKVGVAK